MPGNQSALWAKTPKTSIRRHIKEKTPRWATRIRKSPEEFRGTMDAGDLEAYGNGDIKDRTVAANSKRQGKQFGLLNPTKITPSKLLGVGVCGGRVNFALFSFSSVLRRCNVTDKKTPGMRYAHFPSPEIGLLTRAMCNSCARKVSVLPYYGGIKVAQSSLRMYRRNASPDSVK